MHPITAVQMEWSLWSRDIEEEIIPLCRFIQFTDDVFIILVSSVLPHIRRLQCSFVLDVELNLELLVH